MMQGKINNAFLALRDEREDGGKPEAEDALAPPGSLTSCRVADERSRDACD